MKQQTHHKTKRTTFSQTCCDIMDFYLTNPILFFTPLTTSLSMERSAPTIKDCMNLLRQNNYLSKLPHSTVYFITRENMEFWRTDFKNHILNLEECKGVNLD